MFRLLFILFLVSIFVYVTSRFFLKVSSRTGGSAMPVDAGADLVQDPICGIYLSKKTAPETRKDGTIHYFCGRECAEAFEKKKKDN